MKTAVTIRTSARKKIPMEHDKNVQFTPEQLRQVKIVYIQTKVLLEGLEEEQATFVMPDYFTPTATYNLMVRGLKETLLFTKNVLLAAGEGSFTE